jgi:hypothetical protein
MRGKVVRLRREPAELMKATEDRFRERAGQREPQLRPPMSWRHVDCSVMVVRE